MSNEVKSPRKRSARVKDTTALDGIAGNEVQVNAHKNQINSEKLLLALQLHHRHGYGEYNVKKNEDK